MTFDELEKYYKGKRVLVTGHTGFKGSWLCAVLSLAGAEVYGYSLSAPTKPSLFDIMFGEGAGEASAKDLSFSAADASGAVSELVIRSSHIGDIRNFEELKAFYDEVRPDYVFHLAAQPIVRESYRIPRETYETNVMGTVNLMECVRLDPVPLAVLNVTTDKVYENLEKPGYGYREDDKLDGYDPYSNSKSCSELVTHSYRASFFGESGPAISTARAGNVIGGGDFAKDRIIPDCVRAMERHESIGLRNPRSVRPYQHVLEPLTVYLEIAARSGEDRTYADSYNVGPDESDCVTTGELADIFIRAWGGDARGECREDENGPHEADFLKLDNSKIKEVFSWQPVWDIEKAVEETVNWSKAWFSSERAAADELVRQIREYYQKGQARR